MTAVTYRESCGTPQGAAAHQGAGEGLCGWCAESEAMARLRAEAVPSRPSAPGVDLLKPVGDGQAQANRVMLDKALDGFNWIADRDPASPTAEEAECRDAFGKAVKLRKHGLPVPQDVAVLADRFAQSRREIAARSARPRAGAA